MLILTGANNFVLVKVSFFSVQLYKDSCSSYWNRVPYTGYLFRSQLISLILLSLAPINGNNNNLSDCYLARTVRCTHMKGGQYTILRGLETALYI